MPRSIMVAVATTPTMLTIIASMIAVIIIALIRVIVKGGCWPLALQVLGPSPHGPLLLSPCPGLRIGPNQTASKPADGLSFLHSPCPEPQTRPLHLAEAKSRSAKIGAARPSYDFSRADRACQAGRFSSPRLLQHLGGCSKLRSMKPRLRRQV